MLSLNVALEGAEELKAVLKRLPPQVEQRVLSASLKYAAAPLVNDAKRKAGQVSRTIAGAITTQTKKVRGVRMLRVGPSAGDRGAWKLKRVVNPFTGAISVRFHKPENTAHLVELGTKAHQIRLPHLKITVKHPGTKAHPYMGPALEGNRAVVLGRFQYDAWRRIERIARRAARKKS